MKIMKKALAATLAIAMVLVSFTACSSNKQKNGEEAPTAASTGTPATKAPADEKEPVEITWWNYGNSIGEDLADTLAKSFMDANPWITVNIENKPGDSIAEQISIAANTNALPDIQSGSAQWVMGYATMGLMLPIDDCTDKSLWPEALVKSLSVSGNYYVAPYTNNAIGFAVNRDWLKERGVSDLVPDSTGTWTYDTFTKVLEAVSDADNGKYGLGLYAADTGGDQLYHCLLWGFGAQSYSDDNTKCTLGSPEAVNGLKYLVDLQDRGLTNPGVAGANASDVIRNMFAGGNVCFVMANSGHLASIRESFAEGSYKEFDLDLAPFPTLDGAASNTASFTDGIWLWKTGDESRQEAAKLFMKYLTGTENLAALGAQEGCISPLVNADLSSLNDDEKKAYNLFKWAGNYGISVPGYAEIRPLLISDLQAAFNHEKTAQEALQDFQDKANEAIQANLS